MHRRNFTRLLGSAPFYVPPRLSASTPGKPVLEERKHEGSQWTVCRLKPGEHALSLYLNDVNGRPLRTFKALEHEVFSQGRRVQLAMNAGMYELDGTAVGWCVSQGVTLRGPNTGPGTGNFFLRPNGVFAMENGRARILETAKAVTALKAPVLVTQSGPLLLEGWRIHPTFRKNSENRRVRNGAGVTSDGSVWLAISEEDVTFHGMATLFRDVLKCPDALFLDGVVSSLHVPEAGRNGGSRPLGPLLAVTVPL